MVAECGGGFGEDKLKGKKKEKGKVKVIGMSILCQSGASDYLGL